MASFGFTFDPAKILPRSGYADLPDFPAIAQIKTMRQWVCWRYEDRGGPKPTKVPYQPRTGFKASASNPAHWGTYAEAVARAQRGHTDGGPFNGIGFCLSEDDDLTGIDLDGCRDPNTGDLSPLAQQLVDLGESYCEATPSETGLRILALGKIDKALKRDGVGVEIYGRGRYLTITGWHLPGAPDRIGPAPRTIAALQKAVAQHDAKVAAAKPLAATVAGQNPGSPSSRAPAGEGSPFFRAVNSAALAALHEWVPAIFGSAARFQPGTGAYRVSSQSLGRKLEEDLSIAPNGIRDWGIGDMGDAREGARTPIDLVIAFGFETDPLSAARWLCQQMGRDAEDLGWNDGGAIGAEIAAQLLGARTVVETEGGAVADAETGEILPPPDASAGELPPELANPPGLLGELTDWICDTARRPQRALSIGAALTVIGTLAGRHIAGPTGSGTHLYVVGLAPTGAGKDHPLQQTMTALSTIGAQHLIGPGQFISMPAVINFMARAPLSVCPFDEFGSFLKRINSRKASGFEGAISGMLRTAWGASFKPMPTPEWAGRTAQLIHAPALSIFGVSTVEEFYGALEGGDTSNGVLNRLLVVETRKRPKDRSPTVTAMPAPLVDGLKAILHRGGPLVFSQLQMPDQMPPVYRMPWGPGAEAAFADLVEEINDLCDGDALAQAFYARTAETAIRLASILAVGQNPIRPTVTLEAFRWGRGFAMWCARNLQRGGTEHIADTENQSIANIVRRAIREAGGRMKHRDLLRRLNHRVKNRDLVDVVKALAEAEHIRIDKVVPERGGTPSVFYQIL